MTDTIKDGGPAFPPHHNPETHPSGMTLRDWFAGQALAGVASSPDIGWDFEVHAKWTYAAADAMLAAREVQP